MHALGDGTSLNRPLAIGLRILPTLSEAGYRALLVLAFALPFEATQRPLIRSAALTLTNLSCLYLLTVCLAVLTLWRERARGFQQEQRVPMVLLVLLVFVSGISALFSAHRAVGLKWTLDLVMGGAIWLATPHWLQSVRPARLHRVIRSLAAGGMLAGLVGLVEIMSGPEIDASLLAPFKEQPSLIGSYLRLSGSFQYTNIAGGYLAMTLPLLAAIVPSHKSHRARQIGIAAGLAVMTAALVLTYSRGALLGGAAGFVVLILLRRGWRARMAFPWQRTVLLSGLIGAVALCGSIAWAAGPMALRLTTQSDLEWYRAAYSGHLPRALRPGTEIVVPVIVRNAGTIPWSATGHAPFHLSYHWLLPDGRLEDRDSVRTQLPHDVKPGAHVSLRAAVRTPSRPGRYRFVWDMVQEGVLWFDLHSGSAPRIRVLVRGHPSRTAALSTPPYPRHSFPVLPDTPRQPERSALWSAALRMIAAHPLLGVGPDGYRLSYGLYARPHERSWDTRIYANSLPLELAADIGVVGAALFLAFVVTAAWPLAVRSIRSGSPTWWEAGLLASLAVLFAHGTVDYLLGARSISYLLWILLALIAAGTTLDRAPGKAEVCASA